MKLTNELKVRIDSYFENVSPEIFVQMLSEKYGVKLYTENCPQETGRRRRRTPVCVYRFTRGC